MCNVDIASTILKVTDTYTCTYVQFLNEACTTPTNMCMHTEKIERDGGYII